MGIPLRQLHRIPLHSELKPFVLKQRHTGIDDGFIVEGASGFQDFVQCFFDPERRPVGSGGGHGLDDISHRDDLCLDQNLASGKAAGVPRSVDPFVVLIDDFGNRVFVLDAFQDFVTFPGMLLQDVVFVVGDLARPAKKLRRHVDFPDIVEQARRMHGADMFIAEIHFGGDRLGQTRHPFLVAGGIGVPDFHGCGQCAGGFVQNAPQGEIGRAHV